MSYKLLVFSGNGIGENCNSAVGVFFVRIMSNN
jgi:hypothetical protein